MKDRCVYCEEIKFVKVWDKTNEKVCYDCRLDLLEQEFDYQDMNFFVIGK